MHPINVSKAFIGILVVIVYSTSILSQQLQAWSGINYQIVWAGIGSLMLGALLNITILLYRVLVKGEQLENVQTVLRESGLYQMEAIE